MTPERLAEIERCPSVSHVRELVAAFRSSEARLVSILLEYNAMLENLTSTQARCNELLEENRALRRRA